MKVVGIDCGKHGFIAVLNEKGRYEGAFKMPLARRHNKNHIDIPKLVQILSTMKPYRAVVERQFAMPRQGVSSTFTTGFGYGLIVGMLAALGVEYEVVDANKWQRWAFGVKPKDTKLASIAAVLQWDKKIDLRATEKCKVASDGKADAINIARYGYQLFKEK